MTDMREKVAQALWDAGPKNQDPLGVILVEYFDGYSLDEIKTLVLPLYAEAAIEAIQEPTDEMADKGENALIFAENLKPDRDVPSATWWAAIYCFRQMMLAALEGK